MNRSKLSNLFQLLGRFVPSCFCVTLFAILAVTGCKDKERALAPVSGLITLDGKPLSGASIVCQPLAPPGSVIAGKGSGAFCDADGRFQLETLDGRPGAVIGEHRVRIYGPRSQQASASDGDGGRAKARELVPKKYNHNTELTFTVPEEGTTEANFELTTR